VSQQIHAIFDYNLNKNYLITIILVNLSLRLQVSITDLTYVTFLLWETVKH